MEPGGAAARVPARRRVPGALSPNSADNLPLVMWNGLAKRLEGEIVVLEPIEARHENGLREASRPPEIWTWTIPRGKSQEHFQTWFKDTLAACEAGGEACSQSWIALPEGQSALPAFTRSERLTVVLRSAAHCSNPRRGAPARTLRRSC